MDILPNKIDFDKFHNISNSTLIFYLFLLFPSITFGIVPADIFPWGFIFWITRMRYSIYIFLVFFFTFIFGLFYVIYIQNGISDISIYYYVRNFISLFNAVIPLYVIYTMYKVNYRSFFKVTLLAYNFLLIIGITEYFLGDSVFLAQVKSYLVPNGWWGEVGFGRGISLLSTEPSRASIEVALLYSVLWFYYKKYRIYLTITFIILEMLMIKSVTGAVFCLIAITVAYPLLMIIMFGFAAVTFVFYGLLDISLNNRWVSVLKNILMAPTLSSVSSLIISISGYRIISIIASFKTLVQFPFGLGVGGSNYISEQIYQGIEMRNDIVAFKNNDFGLNYNLKPSSFFSLLLMEIGLLCIYTIIVYFKFILNNLKYKKEGFLLPVIVVTSSLIFLGPVGSPIPFVCLALAVLFNKAQEN